MNHDDTLAAGLIAGYAHGCELRKLAADYLVEKLGGKKSVVKQFGPKALKILQQYGNAAVNAGIGATVGTVVGRSIAHSDHKEHRGDIEIATAAPNIFRAGYEEGLRKGLQSGVGGSK